MTLICRSIAEVLTSTKAKSETPKKLTSSSSVGCYKDVARNLDSKEDTALVGSDASNNCEANSSAKESEPNAIDDITSPRRGRVSKRVQSQAITSEKQNERRAKRSSAEYCLLAGVLSSTSQNPIYRNLIKGDLSWEKLPIMKTGTRQRQACSPAQTQDRQHSLAAIPLKHRNESSAPSSLSTFIENMNRVNSGPVDVLERFLVHVSLHVSDVFGIENADAMTSCVIDCKLLRLSIHQ
jgi:hypothetical protein